jgi:hypothetical protein
MEAVEAVDARNWVIEGFRHVAHSFASFFRTAARVTLHPRAFAVEWASGEFRAFNPLGFFATAVGITGTLAVLVERVTREAESVSWTSFIVHELDPYVSYALLGLLCHLCLKPLGGRRPWYMTLGIALFAGGGPAAVADILTCGVRLAAWAASESEMLVASVDWVAAGSILLARAVFLVALALGLAGIHRLRLWRIGVALAMAEVLVSVIRVLLFKYVIPEE